MDKYELEKYKSELDYNLGQLELDYFQHKILSKLFKKYNTIYFKGGTCLQKCYGITRFSEDLDFNYKEIEIREIITFIENEFKTKIFDKHETNFGTSFSIKFEGILFNGSKQSFCKISFDFRHKDIFLEPLKQIIRPPYKDIPKYFLLALSEEEIFSEKIRTIMTRYKARDVYDLNELIINKAKINFELINEKLKTYNKTFDIKEFEIKLDEKESIYENEMNQLTKIYDDFKTCKNRIMKKLKEEEKEKNT